MAESFRFPVLAGSTVALRNFDWRRRDVIDAAAIIGFLAERNNNARRYVWRAKGEDILRKINAARHALTAQQATS